ncbi:putative protein N(5)-glutamine methyltransferase [Streptomyces sp. NPDC012888]|uniref:putative protein N(5)-glutamine methyltransferase n=1 Tax=Streptomyces sp. NPDC012888 TaxID=3364855 RepID=UPI003680BF91
METRVTDWVVERLRAAGCVFAEEEAGLLRTRAAEGADLEELVRLRAAGRPLEHVVGWAEFCGLRMAVGEGAFVPRRRTEFLVSEAVAVARPGAVVLDLCCGVGALGAAVAAAVPGAELHAADIDPVALEYARVNVAPYGGRVHEGDLYGALPAGLRGRVSLLVANAPYVPTGSLGLLPAEAREYEPRTALDGGPDGLDVQRRLAAGAPDWLAPGGHLLIETSGRQSPSTASAMTAAGLAVRAVSSEEWGATVVVGTRAVD